MRERVFVARENDAIENVVGDDLALDEGRVFIGRVRKKRGDRVSEGDEVHVHERTMIAVDVRVLHRDRELVAVDKPAGISTIPDEHDAEGSLLVRTARTINIDPSKLHATSRLDRGVSGVVIFATSDAARDSLQNARNMGRYSRLYVAISESTPAPREGTWNARIGRAKNPKRRAVEGRDPTDALTRYRVVATAGARALIAVEPVTGRTHQIRVHAAHAHAPLLGDRDYGGSRTIVLSSGKVITLDRVALHCAHVSVEGLIDIRAEIPESLRTMWTALGGDDAAWTYLQDDK